jgi:hypothetical protein
MVKMECKITFLQRSTQQTATFPFSVLEAESYVSEMVQFRCFAQCRAGFYLSPSQSEGVAPNFFLRIHTRVLVRAAHMQMCEKVAEKYARMQLAATALAPRISSPLFPFASFIFSPEQESRARRVCVFQYI